MLQEQGRGPLTSNCASVGGFLRTRPDLPAPDIQLHAGPSMYYDEGLSAPFDHAYSLGPCVAKPTSRGKVSLRSARPDAKLRILHNYLATREDRECMLAGMRVTIQIAEQESLRRYRRAPHLVPASDSEADIWEFVKRRCHSLYHPTSTCAIGRVVDSELRVLGVDGLRVVDASVMPSIVRGNTNAPTIMIAEKASDLIRNKA
jgi:choline dehydrogenase-like flavoprotein